MGDKSLRQRARQRGHGDEFMDMNVDVDPDRDEPATMASERGAGNLGYSGAARKETDAATGPADLAGDEFGGGPSMPMIPGTWAPEGGQAVHDSED